MSLRGQWLLEEHALVIRRVSEPGEFAVTEARVKRRRPEQKGSTQAEWQPSRRPWRSGAATGPLTMPARRNSACTHGYLMKSQPA
jgi:hypothetical protein